MKTSKASAYSCEISDIQKLGSDIYRIKLTIPDRFFPSYFAGQYLEIILQTAQISAFSIASAPREQQTQLELHIQHLSHSPGSAQLLQELKQGNLKVRLPSGNCFLSDPLPAKPLLFIAAGTGFAQMKSMIESVFRKEQTFDMHLYWGARTPGDFYLPHLPVQWASQGLHYHPVVSEATDEDDWCGRHGLLYEAILTDKEKLLGADCYISGSPRMVYATVDAMIEAGFHKSAMHSDVFDYAPRN